MRLNVELSRELYSEFSDLAERSGRSLSDVVRVLIIEWNAKMRREERERSLRIVASEEEGKEGA
jgi:hypothetical protein